MGKLAPFGGLIREMWEAGATDPEIQETLYCEYDVDVSRASLCQWRAARGLKANGQGGRRLLSAEQVARMRRQSETMSYAELQRYWGRSKMAIWRYLHGLHRTTPV